MPGTRLRLSLASLAAALATVPVTAAQADAAAVSYVDGDEVWVASLDGARKVQLTQPGALGPGRWQVTAMADNGRLVAQRREGNSMFPSYALWSPTGALLNNTALPNEPGWTLYVYPLSLDLTADGVMLVYGYSNSRGFVPNATFEQGYYAINAELTRTLLPPLKTAGREWPTTVGDRVLATDGDTDVLVQDPGGPFGPQFRTWFEITNGWEVNRADASADGTVVAVELVRWTGGTKTAAQIVLLKMSGLGGGYVDDCLFAGDGLTGEVSVSPDGTRFAYKDAGGVKVAGVPAFDGPANCNLTAPPVLISPTGTSPSIGGMEVTALPGGGGTPGGGTPGGGTPGGGGVPGGGGTPGGGAGGGGAGGGGAGTRAGAKLRLTLPARARAASLARGLKLTVTAPRAGRLTVTGRVPARVLRRGARGTVVVARGSATARRAGRVTVTLKATAAAKGKLGRLAGRTVALTATLGRAAARSNLRLR